MNDDRRGREEGSGKGAPVLKAFGRAEVSHVRLNCFPADHQSVCAWLLDDPLQGQNEMKPLAASK